MSVEQVIQEAGHDIERVFTPKPGGMIDSIHRHEEARKAHHAETGTVTEQGRTQVKAVRTVNEAPNLVNPSTIVLSASNPIDRALPMDPHRRNAIILAVDNDVYLTADKGSGISIAGTATGTQGFYLPAGIPVPIESKSILYAVATTLAGTSRVSVISFRDSA